MANNKPPKTIGEAVQKLKLFNEKVLTLRRRNFIPQVFGTDHGITLRFSADSPLTVEKRGADEEALHAVITTLRFFVQPGDGISFEQIAALYERLPVEDRAKQSARSAVDTLNKFLAAPLQISFNGESLTNRRLFDVFMYGDLAHANDDKRSEYEKWMKDPAAAGMMTMYLEQIIRCNNSRRCFLRRHERADDSAARNLSPRSVYLKSTPRPQTSPPSNESNREANYQAKQKNFTSEGF